GQGMRIPEEDPRAVRSEQPLVRRAHRDRAVLELDWDDTQRVRHIEEEGCAHAVCDGGKGGRVVAEAGDVSDLTHGDRPRAFVTGLLDGSGLDPPRLVAWDDAYLQPRPFQPQPGIHDPPMLELVQDDVVPRRPRQPVRDR